VADAYRGAALGAGDPDLGAATPAGALLDAESAGGVF
jgi:hypothetical protein